MAPYRITKDGDTLRLTKSRWYTILKLGGTFVMMGVLYGVLKTFGDRYLDPLAFPALMILPLLIVVHYRREVGDIFQPRRFVFDRRTKRIRRNGKHLAGFADVDCIHARVRRYEEDDSESCLLEILLKDGKKIELIQEVRSAPVARLAEEVAGFLEVEIKRTVTRVPST